jgi:hypothetical protein
MPLQLSLQGLAENYIYSELRCFRCFDCPEILAESLKHSNAGNRLASQDLNFTNLVVFGQDWLWFSCDKLLPAYLELTKGQGFPFSYAFQPFLTYIPFFHCVSTRWCFAAGCQYVPVTWVQQGEDFQTRLALNLVVGEILTGHRTRITFSSKWRDKRCPSWNRCGLLSTCPWTVAQTDIRASCWRWSTACMDPRIEQISLQWCLK